MAPTQIPQHFWHHDSNKYLTNSRQNKGQPIPGYDGYLSGSVYSPVHLDFVDNDFGDGYPSLNSIPHARPRPIDSYDAPVYSLDSTSAVQPSIENQHEVMNRFYTPTTMLSTPEQHTQISLENTSFLTKNAAFGQVRPVSEEASMSLGMSTPTLDYSSASPAPEKFEVTPKTFADSDDGCTFDRNQSQDASENGEEKDPDSADPCYAKLLWRCLMKADNHELSLKEIYHWIQSNSLKARDPSSKGWQNSVRHNLSMNAGFVKVPFTLAGKKGSLWRLTSEAAVQGVFSTTRYRKDPKRRGNRALAPAPQRVASGSKGGHASRRAAASRRRAQPPSNTSHPKSPPTAARQTEEATSMPRLGPSLTTQQSQPAQYPLPAYPTYPGTFHDFQINSDMGFDMQPSVLDTSFGQYPTYQFHNPLPCTNRNRASSSWSGMSDQSQRMGSLPQNWQLQ